MSRRYKPPPKATCDRPCAQGARCDCKPGDVLCAKRCPVPKFDPSYRSLGSGGFHPSSPQRRRDWKNGQRQARKAGAGT